MKEEEEEEEKKRDTDIKGDKVGGDPIKKGDLSNISIDFHKNPSFEK